MTEANQHGGVADPGSPPAPATATAGAAPAQTASEAWPIKPGWHPNEPPEDGEPEQQRSPVDVRRRDSWLWLWPLLVLGVMALASHYWGPFGVVVAGVLSISTVLLAVADRSFRPSTVRAILVASCALLLVAFLVRARGILEGAPPRREVASPAAPASHSASAVDLDRMRRGDAKGTDIGPAALDGATLANVNLRGIRAAGASFVGTTFNGAVLAGSDLSGADLTGAHLRGTNLRGASLVGADLRGADLTDACLLGTDLRGAVLDGAELQGAEVAGAQADALTVGKAHGWSTPSTAGHTACQAS